MKRSMITTGALALATILAATGCDNADTTTGNDTSRMSILMTDAPADYSAAFVTIDRIELLGTSADTAEAEGSGRIVLRDEPWTGDLLELRNEVDELVADAIVPSGTYSELRFVVSAGCIAVDEGAGTMVYATSGFQACGEADGSLQMPSFSTSGLKVKLPNDRVELDGDQKILLVDFDVAQSFGHQAGNSGKWVMHPVVTATEVRYSSSIDVSVALADSVAFPTGFDIGQFGITLDDEAAVALTGGDAALQFMAAGNHTLDLVAPAGLEFTTEPALPLTVTTASGQTEQVQITLTSLAVVDTTTP